MMAKLFRKDQNQELLSDLKIAETTFTRMRGLLGTTGLSAQQGMWIHQCNQIHTFFMNYAIDCVFVDKNLRIVSILSDIRPWRMVWPQWRAKSVIELGAGEAGRLGLQVGEQLHVGI